MASKPAFAKGMPCDWSVKEAVPASILSAALQSDSVPESEAATDIDASRCHLKTTIVYAPLAPIILDSICPKMGYSSPAR